MKYVTMLILGSAIFLGASKNVSGSELRFEGDLVLHPNQLSAYFNQTATEISNSTVLEWALINFAKPYKTKWEDVRAIGPFNLNFSAGQIQEQDINFNFQWKSPAFDVGRFSVKDQVVRNVGGSRLIMIVEGECTNMKIELPSANWNIKGRMGWYWNGTSLLAHWKEFSFAATGGIVPKIQLGNCQGSQSVQTTLRESLETAARDRVWMENALKSILLSRTQTALTRFQTELLRSHSSLLKPGLEIKWNPAQISPLKNGLLRVIGQLSVKKDDMVNLNEQVPRSQSESLLEEITESGFVFPKDTIPKIVDFIYRRGELNARLSSLKISPFRSLMQNRSTQRQVWPDLLAFPTKTEFFFDAATNKPPIFGNGTSSSSGTLSYPLETRIKILQWAPSAQGYAPYVDFLTSTTTAKISLFVRPDNQAEIKITLPQTFEVRSQFRKEYESVRKVDPYIGDSIISQTIRESLAKNPILMPLPIWQLSDGQKMTIKKLQFWKQSLNIPLEFKKSK